jgi:hypothetical protein
MAEKRGYGPMRGRCHRGYLVRMFGYVIACVFGLLLVALCFAALGGSRTRPGGRERTQRDSQPAADEPTPDRSVTAEPREIDAARRHTPPA